MATDGELREAELLRTSQDSLGARTIFSEMRPDEARSPVARHPLCGEYPCVQRLKGEAPPRKRWSADASHRRCACPLGGYRGLNDGSMGLNKKALSERLRPGESEFFVSPFFIYNFCICAVSRESDRKMFGFTVSLFRMRLHPVFLSNDVFS